MQGGCYMTPCLANAKPDFKIVHDETFGPLLYLLTYRDFDEAIAINNGVPQGLTSAIFTNDVREAEKFLSPAGSDCGIANVNTGTSGAEIGGRLWRRERKPAAAARAGAIRGRATCGGRRTRSTTRLSCRSPRESNSAARTRAAPPRSRRDRFGQSEHAKACHCRGTVRRQR